NTVVRNNADIFFDFNEPVRTNTEAIMYAVQSVPANAQVPEFLDLPLIIGPALACKPTTEHLTIIGSGDPVDAWWSLVSAPLDTLATGPELVLQTEGVYHVVGHTADGTDTTTFTLGATPVVWLGNDTVICHGSELTLDVGEQDAVLWQDGSTGPTLVVGESGWYVVEVGNAVGCVGVDSLYVIRQDCSTGILNAEQPTPFAAPNPVLDQITINTAGRTVGGWYVRVHDLSGRCIRSAGPFRGPIATLDLHDVPAGTLVIVIEDASGTRWPLRAIKD
ncbi:MAG: hypothetical protein R2818_15700, partial [Flavobacteriales bacterium]